MNKFSQTIAGYPTRQLTVDLESLQVKLLVVRRLEDYVDAEELLRNPDAPEPPYWAHLWTGSRALARRLVAVPDLTRTRVVDIGCGVGLAGIAAAMRGAQVTLFDTAREAGCFARANAALNGCRVHVLQTDVRHAGLRSQFEYCLAADVTYDPLLQQALAAFLARHLAVHGRAWCAESVRTADQGFRRACECLGLCVTERDACEPDEDRPVSVRISEVRWPEPA
jgi:predicted nicotinamide N-methyase